MSSSPLTTHTALPPLSKTKRRLVFLVVFLAFVCLVPLIVFYAIGYRFDFSGEERAIVTVGGMYVSAEAETAEIYIDDEPVEDMRLFQRAAYVQNLVAGMHQVHTQGEGLQTWVKELPVYSHLVTEAASFNLPASSTVRFIAPYVAEDGAVVYEQAASTSRPFQIATTSQIVRFATSTVATDVSIDPEYDFIESLFASTTAERELLAAQEARQSQRFVFAADPRATIATTSATTTREQNELRLEKRDGEVIASWRGSDNNIPFYFCTRQESYATTSDRYGAHVAEQMFTTATSGEWVLASTSVAVNDLNCRTEIRIDRKWQAVIWFEFLPGRDDLVLMQLQDGIYVVEIDDRSWQNVQQLYAGDYLTMIVNNGQILVRDGDIYFELLTEPIAS